MWQSKINYNLHEAISMRGKSVEPNISYQVSPFTIDFRLSTDWAQVHEIADWHTAIWNYFHVAEKMRRWQWQYLWRLHRRHRNQTDHRERNNPHYQLKDIS